MKKTFQYNDEIDWNDPVLKPKKLFGFSFIYLIIILTIIGILYVSNINTIGGNTVSAVVVKDSIADVQDIPLQMPRKIPPIDAMKAGIPSRELIASGRNLFETNCVPCHGEDGKGDGPSAAFLDPKPRNFHSLQNWKNGPKVTQIYKTLEEGMPGSGMASYNYMAPLDLFALIHYIRAFLVNPPVDSVSDLKQLDIVYNLSRGSNIPGQIPVRKVMSRITKETAPFIAEIRELSKKVNSSNAPGAIILKSIIYDETKALSCIVHIKRNGENMDEFIRFVVADPVQVGFKARIYRLSSDEWAALYGFMNSIIYQE